MGTNRPCWLQLPSFMRAMLSSRPGARLGQSSLFTIIRAINIFIFWVQCMTRTSSKSSPDMQSRDLGILAAAVLVGAGMYLLISALTYRVGFPLDDAWIHLTYTRNFASYGQWAFQPGHPSA